MNAFIKQEEDTCRSCLSADPSLQMHSLKETAVMELYTACTTIKLTIGDYEGLPHFICMQCLDFCESWLRFKTLSIKNEETLRSLLNSSTEQVAPGGTIKLTEENEDAPELDNSDGISPGSGSTSCGPNTEAKESKHPIPLRVKPLADLTCAADVRGGISTKYALSTHENAESFECGECHKMFSCFSALQMHATIDHDENVPYGVQVQDCAICGDAVYISQLEKHLRSHRTSKGYECRECDAWFKTLRDIKFHNKWIHDQNKQLGTEIQDCFICGGAVNTSELKMHLRAHRSSMGYDCRECGACFKLTRQLNSHIEEDHRSQVVKKVKYVRKRHAPVGGLVCELCGKQFKQIISLRIHLDSHANIKAHKCDICDRAFAHPNNLRSHKARHKGIRKISCDLCPVRFYKPSEKKAHMKRVHPLTWLDCLACGKKFKSNESLRQHLRKHTGEKAHKCDMCPAAFHYRHGLEKHSSIHTGEKPHECQICHRFFRLKKTLKVHMKTHRDKVAANEDAPTESA